MRLSQRSAAVFWWIGLAVMVAGLIAPFAFVSVPPLSDYPNHLARCFFLAFGTGDAVLSRMFAARWELTPNLAIDLLLPPLMHVLPPLVAGKLFVVATAVLPATGAVALGRACYGRFAWWHLGAGFLAFNAIFLMGLLNFQFSIGIALWGAATWIMLDRASPANRALVGALFAMMAWLAHFYGFCYFALIVGSHELALIVREVRRGGGRSFLKRALPLFAALIAPAVLYLTTTLSGTGGEVVWQEPLRKLFYLLVPVLAYSRLLTELVAAAVVVPLMVWGLRRRLCVAPLAWCALPVLAAAYALLPVGAKGAYWIDTRIPLLIGFLLFATVVPVRLGRLEAIAAVVALSGLFVVRMAYIAEVWRLSASDVADVRAVLAEVAPGSRILTADAPAGSEGAARSRVLGPGFPLSYWHYGAFALLDRRAYWSDVFSLPGQQPLITLPPYSALGDGGATAPPAYTTLPRYEDSSASGKLHYLAGWPGKYDYVLLLNAGAVDAETVAPEHLKKTAQRGIFALYAVRP